MSSIVKRCLNSRRPEQVHSSPPSSACDIIVTDGLHQPSAAFEYSPLDLKNSTIRFLRILPGSAATEIECTLEHQSLTPRTYSCLSYAWGDADVMRTIRLNEAAFMVRENLWDFLWQARENDYEGSLWIDAICIDQANGSERIHAVKEMSQVYKLASEVIVWLGAVPESIGYEMCYRLRAVAQSDGCQYFPMSHQCITWIARSPYWWRAWILPEINLAATLNMMIGCKKIAFNRIREVYLGKLRQQPAGDRAWLVFYAWAPQIAKRRIGFRLIEDSECLYPRDRVYSLTGIIPALRELRIRYDIDNATVLLDVYQQSKPKHLGALNSLVHSLGTSLGAHGILCCRRCATSCTSPSDVHISHLRQGSILSMFDSTLEKGKVEILPPASSWLSIDTMFLEVEMMLLTRETSNALKCSRAASRWCLACCNLYYDFKQGLHTWVIDWNQSQRADDHHLFLSLRYDQSNTDKRDDFTSFNRSPNSFPWWERDKKTYSNILYSHEVLPWIINKNQH